MNLLLRFGNIGGKVHAEMRLGSNQIAASIAANLWAIHYDTLQNNFASVNYWMLAPWQTKISCENSTFYVEIIRY